MLGIGYSTKVTARNAADFLVRNASVGDTIRVYSLAVHSESAIVQIVLVAFVVSAVLKPPDSVPTDVRDKVDAMLAATVPRLGNFDFKALDALGVHGLRALLDRLFPESGVGESHLLSTLVAGRLIHQLGDSDFSAREQAESELKAMGPSVRLILASAIKNPNPEIGVRAVRILRGGEKPFDTSKLGDLDRFRGQFHNFAERVRDRARVEVLARRTAAVLHCELPREIQREVLYHCIGPVARLGDDKLLEVYRPFLDDPVVGAFVVDALGAHRPFSSRFPLLLLDALESPHEKIVDAALGWATRGWDEDQTPEVRRRLKRIVEGKNESLKSSANFVLMHSFRDPDAFRYFVERASKGDKTAICYVGDSCHWRRPATKEVLDALVPHLTSEDVELRRAASEALGTYSGEVVIRHLLTMLADKEDVIASYAMTSLIHGGCQKDPVAVRKLVEEAAKIHPDLKARGRASEVLKKLDEQKKK